MLLLLVLMTILSAAIRMMMGRISAVMMMMTTAVTMHAFVVAPLTAAERQLISTWICQGATAN